MTMAERLRLLVKNCPRNRRQIASDLCISFDCLNNYLYGRRRPDADMVRQLALYFHVSADYILCISDAPEANKLPPSTSQDEWKLVMLFRSMTHSQRECYLDSGYGIVRFSAASASGMH